MLSAEGAKAESNNRRKSDLGHLGRRFVGGWVSGYVWYLELSREPKHAAQQMRYQNVDLSNGCSATNRCGIVVPPTAVFSLCRRCRSPAELAQIPPGYVNA